MDIQKCIKESFTVIGREGSTMDGEGFIAQLWQAANEHFSEVQHLAAVDENGQPLGFWGAMSDMSHSFLPWQNNFSEGLYLAGVECREDAEPPKGWTKWIIPGYEYLYAECTSPTLFPDMLQYIEEQGLQLEGAVHDFTCPQTGKNYMFFPIRKL